MKTFEAPVVEVKKFALEDILTTSTTTTTEEDINCEWDAGF